MRQEWIDWFIDHINSNESKLDYWYGDEARELPRSYSSIGVLRNEVPFDNELDQYIAGKINHSNYVNTGYILIKYGVGDYIGEHVDYALATTVTYTCELQASDCGSKLLVDGVPMDEAVYDNTVKHEVKPIMAGERISLVMFGKKQISLL